MKKVIAVILCVVMIFSVTACSKNKNDEKKKDETVITVTPVATEAPKAEDSEKKNSEEPAITETPVVTEEPVQDTEDNGTSFVGISLCPNYDVEWADDYDYQKYSLKYQTVFVSSEYADKYPKLDMALKEFSQKADNSAMSMRELLDECFDELVTNAENVEEALSYTDFYYETEYCISRADSVAVSLVEVYNEYTGGAHGNYGLFGTTFDTQTGAELTINDIVTDSDAFAQTVINEINKNYPDTCFFTDLNEVIKPNIAVGICNFSLGYDGVTVLFNPYDIASYADGVISADILFCDYPELFNERFLSVPDGYMINMIGAYAATNYLACDGRTRTVSVEPVFCEYGDDGDDYGGDYEGFEVVLDENEANKLVVDDYGWDLRTKFIKNVKGEFLLVESTGPSDMTNIYTISLEDKPVVKTTLYCAGIAGEWLDGYDIEVFSYDRVSSPERIELSERIDMIGTNFWHTGYRMDDEGYLTRLDEYYMSSNPWPLTLRQTISVPEVDFVTGELTGKEIELAEGSEIEMVRTNGVDAVDCSVNNSEVYVRLVLNGYPSPEDPDAWVVNGYYNDIYLDELFDGISYAG